MSRVIAVYPGTFDPITNGHVDIIQRASRIFPGLLVLVSGNPSKKTLFTLSERLRLVHLSIKKIPYVRVESFTGLTVEFARRIGAKILIRGLRAVSDFEYEMQMGLTNRKINRDIESVYLMPQENYIYLSSSVVKEIVRFGGDVSGFVSDPVLAALKRKMEAVK